MYEDRGEMASTFIVCYALSSAVAGHVSGSYYRLLSYLEYATPVLCISIPFPFAKYFVLNYDFVLFSFFVSDLRFNFLLSDNFSPPLERRTAHTGRKQ